MPTAGEFLKKKFKILKNFFQAQKPRDFLPLRQRPQQKNFRQLQEIFRLLHKQQQLFQQLQQQLCRQPQQHL